jgi:succinate dehydrogenase / fumarate reductase cytochrome b subunit
MHVFDKPPMPRHTYGKIRLREPMSTPQNERPLSPHLSVYRWQITNTLSILHRITGFGLALGLVLFAVWLMSVAWCPELFATLSDFFGSIVGKLFLFGWTVAFYYHLANGIRHLYWDMGRGFALDEVTASGQLVLVFAGAMTVLTWAIVYQKGML